MNVLLIDSTTKIVEHEINLYNFTCFADIAEELNIDSVTLIPLDDSETQDYPTFCFNKDKTINEIIFDFIELSDEDQSIGLAYNQYINSYLNNMDEILEKYYGVWDSEQDFAENLIEEIYGSDIEALPELIRYHIDYHGITRDLFMTDYNFINETNMVFLNY